MAEYKDLEALMAASVNKWVNKEDHLSCQSILDGAGNPKITGAACGKHHKKIQTRQMGKCDPGRLNLSCRTRNGDWNETKASCKTLLENPAWLSNDDGKIVEDKS
ncbi:MAG: hypothetical protein ABGY43_11235 [bacterium]